MKKIWIVESKWHKRSFKTEKTFLDFIDSIKNSKYSKNYKVSIYGLLEEHDNSDLYLDSFLTQKERDEQLSSLLYDNIEVSTIQKINSLILAHIELEKDSSKKFITFKNYLKQIKLSTLSQASFKKIINSDPKIRIAFLYEGPNTIEWYQTILSLHNFKFDKQYHVGRNTFQVDDSRIQNFMQAKKLNKSRVIDSK